MAVVGNVGTYAQVQAPQGPDFGGMVKNEFDKKEAEKKAAKLAAAKLADEKLKSRKEIGGYKQSGLAGYDESLSKVYKDFYSSAMNAKLKYEETGDSSYLYEYDNIVNEMDTITNESAALGDYFKEASELAKSGKLNDANYKEVMETLQQLRDGKAKYYYRDGKGYVQLLDENGEPQEEQYIGGFVKDNLNLVGDFDVNDSIKKVVDTVKASVTQSGNYYNNTKITDINSEQSKPQRERLEATAQLWSTQDESMTRWYQSEKKPTEKKRKTTGWTDDERREAKEWYNTNLLNSYAKSLEKGFGKYDTGGGSGSKEDETSKPTLYKLSSGVGQGYSWDARRKNTPILTGFSIQTKDGKQTLDEARFKNVYYREEGGKGFIMLKYATPTGSLTSTFQKAAEKKEDDLVAMIEAMKNAKKPKELIEEKKQELEKVRDSLSGQKLFEERTAKISVLNTEVIGNIANSLGRGSDQEFINEMKELAGFKSGGEVAEGNKIF